MNINEASVLITGGASGIGLHLAEGLLKKANRVFVLDRNEELLSQITSHERLIKLPCDVTNPHAVVEVVNKIFKDHGGVNVCINNAGIIHSELLVNLGSATEKTHSIENWKRVIDVNLNAVFYVTAPIVEKWVENRSKGLVINISSISAQGNLGQSAYSASKAAVEALTKTWSREWGVFKIRSCCIAPGFFNTPSTRASLSESTLGKWQKAVPLGRLGELKELLTCTEFIIENDYFNGKVLSLDGGLTL